MPWVTDEQIARAKEVGILEYLQAHEPYNLKRDGPNRYILRDHDSFVISKGKWCWNSRGFGSKTGRALEYLVKVRGYSFTDAVLELCGDAPVFHDRKPVNPPPPKKQQPFALPPRNRDDARAIAYLQSRGIDREIIDLCIRAGTLYESKKYHNCAFIGYNREGKARFACVRGTTSNFRQDMESSDKRYGFCFPAGIPPGRELMAAESPIDALSLATLRKMESPGWNSRHYLALGGTSPLALIQYLTDHPEIEHITLCLDNDKAGCEGAEKIMAAVFACGSFRGRSLSFTVEPPPIGNDYNDTLQDVQRQIREQRKTSHHEAAVSL